MFLLVYVNVTPYDKMALIRQGKIAAAVSLTGALFGFAMPVAIVVAHSDTLADRAAWGAIAGVAPIPTCLLARIALTHLADDIPAGKIAPATFLATLSQTVGPTNAAGMSYQSGGIFLGSL